MADLYSDILIELHVPDFTPVKDFYGSIGYEIVWEKSLTDNKSYLVLRNGNSILNFYGGSDAVYKQTYFKRFPKETPKGYGVEIIIPINGIETFYEDFKKKHQDSVVEELSQRYSQKDFRASDPFGYYLRFVERYNWVDGRDKSGNPIA